MGDNMGKQKSKRLQQYRIVLKNDEVTPLDKVVTGLMHIAHMDMDEAVKKAMEVHVEQSAILLTAHFELAETISTRLNNIGLKSYIEKDLV